jgi:hypothetical protein
MARTMGAPVARGQGLQRDSRCLRLDGQDHRVGARHRIGILGNYLNTEFLAHPGPPRGIRVGDTESVCAAAVGDEPADETGGHVATADEGEADIFFHRSVVSAGLERGRIIPARQASQSAPAVQRAQYRS